MGLWKDSVQAVKADFKKLFTGKETVNVTGYGGGGGGSWNTDSDIVLKDEPTKTVDVGNVKASSFVDWVAQNWQLAVVGFVAILVLLKD